MTDMNINGFSPPLVDNRFGFQIPMIYQQVSEPSFDWSRYRRNHLQFEKAESLHDSHIYDRHGNSMATLSQNPSSCLCMFCRKHFTEDDRPQGLPTKEDLKQLFPINDFVQSKKTVTYLSRPSSAPFRQSTFSIANTSAPRYIPSLKNPSSLNNFQQKSTITSQFGMRLDAEPNHDHSRLFDLPRERDAVFRSLDDYFHMTFPGRPTMIL